MATLCVLVFALTVSIGLALAWAFWFLRVFFFFGAKFRPRATQVVLLLLAISLPALAKQPLTKIKKLPSVPIGTSVRVHGTVKAVHDDGQALVYLVCDNQRNCTSVRVSKSIPNVQQPNLGDVITAAGKRVE